MSHKNGDQLPPPDERKKIVRNQRDQYRRAAYTKQIEAAGVEAQMGLARTEDERKSMVEGLKDIQRESSQAYAHARKMDEILTELEKDFPSEETKETE